MYKVADATERDLLQTNPGLPKRDVMYEHSQPAMREIDREEATRRVLSGESLLVEGIAGTGKTFFVQQLISSLRALGKSVASRRRTRPAVGLEGAQLITGFGGIF